MASIAPCRRHTGAGNVEGGVGLPVACGQLSTSSQRPKGSTPRERPAVGIAQFAAAPIPAGLAVVPLVKPRPTSRCRSRWPSCVGPRCCLPSQSTGALSPAVVRPSRFCVSYLAAGRKYCRWNVPPMADTIPGDLLRVSIVPHAQRRAYCAAVAVRRRGQMLHRRRSPRGRRRSVSSEEDGSSHRRGAAPLRDTVT